MIFDKKKAAQAIVSRIESPEKNESPEEMVDHDFAGLHAASEDMIQAIHNKNPKDMHKALSSYLELHKQLQPGEGPDNSPSENERGVESPQMKYNR